MNYLPVEFLGEEYPYVFTNARPKFIGYGGSGYPWHFLNEEPMSETEALMLMDRDCFEGSSGEDFKDCWSS